MLDLMVGGLILLQVWLRQLCSYVSGTVTLFEWIAPGCFSVKCQTWKTKTKQLTDNQWKPQGAAAAMWEAVAVVARSPNQKVLMTWEQTNWKEMKKSIKLRWQHDGTCGTSSWCAQDSERRTHCPSCSTGMQLCCSPLPDCHLLHHQFELSQA